MNSTCSRANLHLGEVVPFPRARSHPNAATRLSGEELERYLDMLNLGYAPDLAIAVLGRTPCDGVGGVGAERNDA